MKSPIVLTTLFAVSLAAVGNRGISLPPLPTPTPTPTPRGCPPLTDFAITAGVKFFRSVVKLKYDYFDEAVDLAVARFRYEIGCLPSPPESGPLEPGDVDCKNDIDPAILAAYKVLKNGFGAIAPPGFEVGVEEGIKIFKLKLRCKEVHVGG